MAAQSTPTLTEQEYLAMDRAGEFRSEYWFGTAVAMSAGSFAHSRISSNLNAALVDGLTPRDCFVCTSDMRLRVSPEGLYVYPDIMVVCGVPEFSDSGKDTLLNPSVVVEVLSPTTEAYDGGRKSWHYRKLESLREYVVVEQDAQRIECYHRRPNQEWLLTASEGLNAGLILESLELNFPGKDLREGNRRIMAAQSTPTLTEQEYLAMDRAAEFRNEYWFGTVVAMSGGSLAHSLIASNLNVELGHRLKGRGCFVFNSDMRLQVSPQGLYVYPDLMVVCGEAALADSRQDILLNPSIIVEVLSPSTENYDMGRKSWHYRRLDSLREYVVVEQDRARIECYHRRPNQEWLITVTEGLEANLKLESLDLAIPLAEIYANVSLQ